MSVDKLVDSTQLDSDLTSVANAIRTKGGTSAQLAFPNGFVSAIDAIPTGGTLITKTITENGIYSAEDDDADGYSEVTVNVSGGGVPTLFYNNVSGGTLYAEETIIDSDTPISVLKRFAGASNLKKIRCLKTSDYGGSNANSIASAFSGCTLLEEVTFLNGMSTSGYCEDIIKDCPNIKTFTTGDIGYPNTVGMGSASGNYKAFRNIAIAFDIIIYTTATSLANVPSNIKNGSPWGATNATVIYKNSVTGDVLT